MSQTNRFIAEKIRDDIQYIQQQRDYQSSAESIVDLVIKENRGIKVNL